MPGSSDPASLPSMSSEQVFQASLPSIYIYIKVFQQVFQAISTIPHPWSSSGTIKRPNRNNQIRAACTYYHIVLAVTSRRSLGSKPAHNTPSGLRKKTCLPDSAMGSQNIKVNICLVQAGQDGDAEEHVENQPNVKTRRGFQDAICPDCSKEGKKAKAQTMKWCKGFCKRHAGLHGYKCDSSKSSPSSKASPEEDTTMEHKTPATTDACSKDDRQDGTLDRLPAMGKVAYCLPVSHAKPKSTTYPLSAVAASNFQSRKEASAKLQAADPRKRKAEKQ